MAPRASSPALSENEFDITNALFGGDDQSEKGQLDADLGVDLDIGGEDGSDDEAFIAARQAISNRKATNVKGKSVKKGGGFQAMGLNAALLRAITRKGFTVPTPIQRKTIPLVLDGQDVVGMARTGSGKTAAFVIPMIERLKTHSPKVGARGIILSPSRELALQTLKVIKELGKGTDLRTILLVGGDSLEDQFSSMVSNPDIIVATPGRFLHLKVEMKLTLESVKYIVFDEADRLFEMGFAAQLAEILYALPTSRQTLLFSATLPKSLVEFARAGLQEPQLVRLDAESKISPDLQNTFFMLKNDERDGALLNILDKVIKMPLGETEQAKRAKDVAKSNAKKRKRGPDNTSSKETPTEYSTIIFAATKHRVEYLSAMLAAAGYSVSYIYGSLDQTARKIQVQNFRSGLSHVLVVTDVAARGIDLPQLQNVINYDFSSQPKIFVHRVGRTARAGRKGWSYSLIRETDLPYLIDLQLFLSRRLVVGRTASKDANFAQDIVVGSLLRDQLEPTVELANRLLIEDPDLEGLQSVAIKGEKQYIRTRNAASTASVKQAKQLLGTTTLYETHQLFDDEQANNANQKEEMLARIASFRPAAGETVFEIGKRGTGSEVAEIMRRRREEINHKKQNHLEGSSPNTVDPEVVNLPADETDDSDADMNDIDDGASDSDDLEVSISQSAPRNSGSDPWQSSEFYMGYTPTDVNVHEDRGYGVHSGSNTNFVEAARGATLDLTNDEVSKGFGQAVRAGMRWDKKNKKYVARANDDDGSKGAKMIRGESGAKIAASYLSGRYDDWRKKNKMGRLRTGENEAQGLRPQHGRVYKHKTEKAPKEADKYRDDYDVQKKRVQEAKDKRIGKFKDGNGKSELKGVDDVRKQRKQNEKRREKNARPSKKRKS
ncbi:ATP-dependent RNA helicase-like protein dbp10 [Aaosphaeria arxii CBS 175.79]|uniref:RNA helicase n=1 Tax=Aaosphaeria arxii CBS 175.79 TaxID=1450172 RepID=A0A6A5Y158_9PLEO|nr:ATP-dependent RNA helicase-like protein dbp10 [Aaosphaeria arxii CBS 175.79]KAF2018989.1 ATP-dependent RNA helicase-like protein dbp10 [Aaosphaeria arxii CBS 175.79]